MAITFKEVLNVDSIQNLKEGFGMMGMRFKGKPSKGMECEFLLSFAA